MFPKVYEVDPLICPKCKDEMIIIGFIERVEVFFTTNIAEIRSDADEKLALYSMRLYP